MKKQYGTLAIFLLCLQGHTAYSMGDNRPDDSNGGGDNGGGTDGGGSDDGSANTGNTLADISTIAAASTCSSYSWKDRGRAPASFVKGMALTYAKSLCRLRNNENAAVVMAQKNRNNSTYDAFTWYEDRLDNMNFEIDVSGSDSLRSLYAMGIGLGMRESSGKYCEGRDRSATNTTSESAEAGMFQTSWNARVGNSELSKLVTYYTNNPSKCLLSTYKVGISCSSRDLENYGSGDGLKFQKLAKSCPAFAAEFAMITLRTLRKHYGPIVRREVELISGCYKMLDQVQDYVNSRAAAVCSDL